GHSQVTLVTTHRRIGTPPGRAPAAAFDAQAGTHRYRRTLPASLPGDAAGSRTGRGNRGQPDQRAARPGAVLNATWRDAAAGPDQRVPEALPQSAAGSTADKPPRRPAQRGRGCGPARA